MSEINWTEDRVTQLCSMHRNGLSNTQIAGELGGISRCAVGAKLHRMGLIRDQGPRRSRPRTNTFINAVAVTHNKEARKLDRPVIEKAQPNAPTPLLISLVELKPRHCRWPVGDPGTEGFGFCGHAKADNSSYCPHHHGVAYQPSAPRRIREPA